MGTLSSVSREQGVFWDKFEGTKNVSTIKRNFEQKHLGTRILSMGNKGEKVEFSRDQGNMLLSMGGSEDNLT